MASRRASLIRFNYDTNTGQYFDPRTRQFVPRSRMIDVMNQRIAASNELVAVAVAQAQAGEISFSQMQSILTTEVRNLNVQLYALGKGGFNQMTQADYGRAGNILRTEYTYMRKFISDIQTGNMTPAQVANRYNLYMDHAWQSYWTGDVQAKATAGFTEEKRDAENDKATCDDCRRYDSDGWQPINTFPRPGQKCQCKARCRCEVIYRKRVGNEWVLSTGERIAA